MLLTHIDVTDALSREYLGISGDDIPFVLSENEYTYDVVEYNDDAPMPAIEFPANLVRLFSLSGTPYYDVVENHPEIDEGYFQYCEETLVVRVVDESYGHITVVYYFFPTLNQFNQFIWGLQYVPNCD